MMSFALKYWKAIDVITADKALKLHKFELDDPDWRIIGDLVAVLEQYKKATVFFSRDIASIAAIIPAMDKITDQLNHRSKEAYHPAIQVAMKAAATKLNRYYASTDSSAVYRIAMGRSLIYNLDHY
jgi:hypothetical protein